jgi:exopolysaccharide biosynthesis polyprenyl glycosylphosphotransferase
MIHFTHLRRRKWFAALDFAAVCVAVAIAFYVRTRIPLPVFQGLLPDVLPSGFNSMWLPAAVLGFVFIFTQYAFGVYDLWHSSSTLNWLQRVLPANIVLVTTAFSFLYITQNFGFPRSLLATVFFANYLISALWRVAYFKLTATEMSDVVLVGKWPDLQKLLAELSSEPFSNHVRITAVFTPESHPDIPVEAERTYLVLPFSEFENYSTKNPYASVILAPSDAFQQQAFSCVLTAARRGVNVYAVPSIYEILLGRLQHLRINDLPLLELRLNPPSNISLGLKRAFDVVLAATLFVVLAVPMLAVTFLVVTTSRGPAVYSQIRTGLLGREFRIYKFRTMRVDAERQTGAVLAKKGDPRITKIGKFLRATRLDELPQLWNILRGDMSFVGPRPERPVFVSQFEQNIPGYTERHRIRPGVTGLAQVSGGYESTPDIKLKYDLAYLSNLNLILDAQILFRTMKTVLTKAGM